LNLATGDLISHYRIIAEIGEGGMGKVYRARDERLGREVAVKLLKNRGDTPAVERFIREARAASALNHPNIVTVFDAGEVQDAYFIAMELVQGSDLRSLISRPFPNDRFVNLVRQIAEALSVAHEVGIVHRDIKPENIRVRHDGYVKILDFGLARLVTPPTATKSTGPVTESSSLIGTIKYMSPEQAVGRTADTSSDVFSLGIVLYELATGQHPFEAESLFGVLEAIVSHRPVSPSRLNDELPEQLDALILSMLDKDPARRPTALDVAAAVTAPTVTTPRGRSVPRSAKRHSVGRLEARMELQGALEYAWQQSRGLLVCVSGEPGIGKTTFVDDFLSDLMEARRDCWIARGRCSERLAGTEAYLPLLDALEDLLRGYDEGPVRLMKAVAPLWYAQVRPATSSDSSKLLAREARSGTQERLKRELVAFLSEACLRKPLVLSFDDLHWVDISTVDLLAYVSRQFESLPLLIIVTYRPEELLIQRHPFVSLKSDLQARGSCREIALEFLTRENIEQYVTLRFPKHRFPVSFIDMIFAKTEGNPLFAVEVLSYLAEQQVVSLEEDSWTLTRSVPDLARDLPQSVRGMIHRKLDSLTETDRRLLVAASVQGYEFDGAVAARVLGLDPGAVEEQVDAIDRFQGLVRQTREHELPDGTLTLRYRFVHVLYQNILYASLTPARKAALGRAVAKALEEFYRDHTGDIASELAVLYESARDFSVAAEYFRIAAKRSAQVFANEEAFALGKRALTVLGALSEGAERRRRELAILMTMGVPALASRGFSSPDVQAVFNRARTLCAEFHEADQLARVLWGLGTNYVTRLQLVDAQEVCDRLYELATQSQDSGIAVHADGSAAVVHYYAGDFKQSLKCLEDLPKRCDLGLRRSACLNYSYDPIVAACAYRGSSLWCLGYPDRGLTEIMAGVDAAAEVEHRYMLAFALTFVVIYAFWRGDWDQAKTYNEKLLLLAAEEGFTYFVAVATCHDGLLLAQQGRATEGLARFRDGLIKIIAIGGRTSQRRLSTDWADLLMQCGEHEEAVDVLNAEIASMRQGAARFWEAEIIRVRGELLLIRDAGSSAEAERSLQAALDVARQQEAKSLELRAAMSLSRLWMTQGRSREAHALLSPTYGWFTEGFDTADLKRAQQLLAEILGSTN
jgi:predicted ATPase